MSTQIDRISSPGALQQMLEMLNGHCIEQARASRPQAKSLGDRYTVIGGDMLEDVPYGGDAYLIKWVLMDRPDGAAVHRSADRGCSPSISWVNACATRSILA